MAKCRYRMLGSGICEKICEDCVFTYGYLSNLTDKEAKNNCNDFDTYDGKYEKTEKENEQLYYIVSNEHTEGLTRCFWARNFCNYTIDLNRAGKYTLESVQNGYDFPIITKENLNERGKYDSFLIAVEDVELLGRKMSCILN